MYEYYTQENKPNSKKYIQVNIIDFYKHIKKEHGGEHTRSAVFDMFANHHCNIYRNDSMFVFERFFQGDDTDIEDVWTDTQEGIHNQTLYYLKTFLEKHGYVAFSTAEEFIESDRGCIFPGYDGILMDIMW